MAIVYYARTIVDFSARTLPAYLVCDTDAEKPASGLVAGDLAFAVDNGKLYKATDATTWVELAAGAGGPVILENLSADPVSPSDGEIWLRTDL